MKKYLAQVCALFMILFAVSASVQAAAQTFTLDPNHSYVAWRISHFDFSYPSGKWLANGTLVLDKNKLQADKVNVTINTADIVTGIPELDKHLKGELFLDVTKYPTAIFVSNKVVTTGKKTADVYGTLTLHGVSKPVTLKVTLNKVGVSPITNLMTAGFSATASLKRSDFGITTLLPGLGDDVELSIQVEATLKQ